MRAPKMVVATVGLVLLVALVAAASKTRSMVLALPTEEPRGFVEIASFGMAEVTPDRGVPILALHVRMTVTNMADSVPWSFDVTDATAGIDGHPQARALFVNSDVEALPLARLPRGERRIIDLYFPAAAEPTHFDFAWRFKTGIRVVETHVGFLREDDKAQAEEPTALADDPPAQDEDGTAQGDDVTAPRTAWFDPAYPWPSRDLQPGVAGTPLPQDVVVAWLPHGHYHVASIRLDM